MLPYYFLMLGGLIFFTLGILHLYFTFFTNKFQTRPPETVEHMKQSHPVLTSRTTMWKAWIGFNASHSFGAIYFGLLTMLLAMQYPELVLSSSLLLPITVITALAYFFLALKFWFRIPLIGVGLATGCFLISFVLLKL